MIPVTLISSDPKNLKLFPENKSNSFINKLSFPLFMNQRDTWGVSLRSVAYPKVMNVFSEYCFLTVKKIGQETARLRLEAETDPTRPLGSCEAFELKAPFVTMTFPLRGRVTQIERLVPGIYDLDFRCGSATTTQTITIEAGQNLRIRQAASSDE